MKKNGNKGRTEKLAKKANLHTGANLRNDGKQVQNAVEIEDYVCFIVLKVAIHVAENVFFELSGFPLPTLPSPNTPLKEERGKNRRKCPHPQRKYPGLRWR